MTEYLHPEVFTDRAEWRTAVAASGVRVQWDPDHDPRGARLARRVIQLGLRGESLRSYAHQWPVEIRDVTGFVAAQREHVRTGDLDRLRVPVQVLYEPGVGPAGEPAAVTAPLADAGEPDPVPNEPRGGGGAR